jgi:hypothetical protein
VPPQTEFATDLTGGKQQEAALKSFLDDLDQTHLFDPAEPEPVPVDNFDQTWGE